MGLKAGDELAFETNGTGCSIRVLRADDPFEKYRGIGNPGLPRGKKAIIRWIREMRGGL